MFVGAIVAARPVVGASGTTDPNGLVDAARAGFDSYLAGVEPPDSNDDPDEFVECPVLTPEQIDEAIAAIGYDETAFNQRQATLHVERAEGEEASLEYPVLVCRAEVYSELRATPMVQVGAARLPDGVSFADLIATADDVEASETTEVRGPSPAAHDGDMTTICESGGECFLVWEMAGLLVLVGANETAAAEFGEADLQGGLDVLLEPVLRSLADLPTIAIATTAA
jgi:hypothetical protein